MISDLNKNMTIDKYNFLNLLKLKTMKRTIYLIAAILITNLSMSQTQCVSCNNNTVDFSKFASAVGEENTSDGHASFASGFQNVASGDYSAAIGYQNTASGKFSLAGGEQSIASGKRAFAFGRFAEAQGLRSFAQGLYVTAMGGNSVVMGRFARTLTSDAMIIGYGKDMDNYLENSINGSLMIGFNSDLPTFFVGPASEIDPIGKVGIGTTDPTAKLEVNGTFKVTDWSFLKTIDLDDSDIKNIDELQGHDGLKFKGKTLQTSTQMILTEDGKLGIGTLIPNYLLDVAGDIRFTGQLYDANGLYEPGKWESNADNIYYNGGNVGIGVSIADTKLEVGGKIKSSGSNSALILESPDGTEWEITIDNSGNLSATQIIAVFEAGSQNDIYVYPNPTENKVTIDLKTSEIKNVNIELFDLSGKIVFMKFYRTNMINLDLNDFESGTYILKLKDENGNIVRTEKIIKE